MPTFRFSTAATLLLASLAAAPAFAQPTDAPPPPPPAPDAPPAPPPADPWLGGSQPAPVATPTTPPIVTPTGHENIPAQDTSQSDKPKVFTLSTKWEAQLYGFVEFDMIQDSAQSFVDSAGNGAIARPHTYAGDHGQMQFGARNSRIGLKLAAPEYNGIKVSSQLEMDFLGNQPGKPFDATGLVSEAAFWNNPGFRIRHMNVKAETPSNFYVLAGQYWELFGWQSAFHPNTVEIQGIPGQIYSRTPQLRFGKLFKGDAVTVDVAVAALRPPDKASSTPDGQAGIKLSLNHLKGWRTAGATGTALDAASLGVSVDGRRFAATNLAAAPNHQVTANGGGVSVDLFLPIVPATKENKQYALTLTGSFVYGAGIADLYTGLNGGAKNPALPANAMGVVPTYTANIDPGLAMYLADGSLHAIQWTSEMAGLQFYLTKTGRVWLSANYTHMSSGNIDNFGAKTGTFKESQWADANIFLDVTPAFRVGLEGAYFDQTYSDGTDAPDYRGQFSAFFIF